jgi:hypothetical protein
MSRERRMRALANAGKVPRVQKEKAVRGERKIPAPTKTSHSKDDAANSENSALGSTSSPTGSLPEGSHAEAVGANGVTDLSGYSWYQEYVTLAQRFPWRLAAYIAWAASPVMGRVPATQLALAQALGLKTDRTIRQWKEKDATIDQVIAELQAAPLWRHRRDLYEALVRTAVAGDVPALKLAFEMTGDYTPRLKQTVDNTIKPGSYTADDLAAAERELEGFAGNRTDRSNRIDDAQGDKVAR